jgi:hypothetical protein
MDLKDIAAVSGKGGLFRVLKPTRTGVILEALDTSKAKMIANANMRVSILKEISVYTTGKESSLPLENVFRSIYEKYGKSLKVNAKSADTDLRSFLESVVPDYDSEKVYNSDIRKIVNWYSILMEHFPGIFDQKPEEKESKKAAAEEPKKKEEKPKALKEEKAEKKESRKTEEKEKPKTKTAAKKK